MADSPVTALSTGRAVIPGWATRRAPAARGGRRQPGHGAVPAPAVRNLDSTGFPDDPCPHGPVRQTADTAADGCPPLPGGRRSDGR
jgi:hypothetical protein